MRSASIFFNWPARPASPRIDSASVLQLRQQLVDQLNRERVWLRLGFRFFRAHYFGHGVSLSELFHDLASHKNSDRLIIRETLYRTPSPTGNPALRASLAVLKTVGMRLSVEPAVDRGELLRPFAEVI